MPLNESISFLIYCQSVSVFARFLHSIILGFFASNFDACEDIMLFNYMLTLFGICFRGRCS